MDAFHTNLTDKGMYLAEETRTVFAAMLGRLREHIPESLESEAMLMRLQEAEFWAIKALATIHSEKEY